MKDSLDVAEWIRYAEMDYNTSLHLSETYHPVPHHKKNNTIISVVCFKSSE